MSSSLRKVKTAPKKIFLDKILKNPTKRARLVLLGVGILFTLLGLFLSGEFRKQYQETPSVDVDYVSSFKQEPVKIDKALTNPESIGRKKPPVRLIIPSRGVDVSVKEARIVEGYWEVFDDTAGFGLGSAYPVQEKGNQVIFAHAREGLFLPLKKIKVDDKIYVMTDDNYYSYKVRQIKEVLPSQTEVISPTEEAILTLYTCSGFADSKRLIVVAQKV